MSSDSDSYFTREGARIAYQFAGSGSPLGYAHGVPLSRAIAQQCLNAGLLDEAREVSLIVSQVAYRCGRPACNTPPAA